MTTYTLRIGSPAQVLPSWVPPEGEVAVLSVANGKLTNNFRDACSPFFETFYFRFIVNDYAGAVKNPFYGQFGATMWFGGGHSATNNNQVTALEYGLDSCTFKRVCDPTNWFPANPSLNDATSDIGALLNTSPVYWIDSVADNKPLNPHSWKTQFLQTPANGGDTCGTFYQVTIPAGGIGNRNTTGVFKLPITSASADSDSLVWERDSATAAEADGSNWSGPIITAHVPTQNRTYILTANLQGLRWYDHTTKAWVTGTGTPFDYQDADQFVPSDVSWTMFYVPDRELVVYATKLDGELRLQWMDVTQTQPTAGSVATLSETVSIANKPWSSACWCKKNNRILVFGASDIAAIEIEIPATLSDEWPVTVAPYGSGQSFPLGDGTGAGGDRASSFGKIDEDETIGCVVNFPIATQAGADLVYVYNPRSL